MFILQRGFPICLSCSSRLHLLMQRTCFLLQTLIATRSRHDAVVKKKNQFRSLQGFVLVTVTRLQHDVDAVSSVSLHHLDSRLPNKLEALSLASRVDLWWRLSALGCVRDKVALCLPSEISPPLPRSILSFPALSLASGSLGKKGKKTRKTVQPFLL